MAWYQAIALTNEDSPSLRLSRLGGGWIANTYDIVMSKYTSENITVMS